MWLCKRKVIEKKDKKRRKWSKRWTSVPTIKTMGTSMPASHSNEKVKREKERIKIAHVFLRKVPRSKQRFISRNKSRNRNWPQIP